MHTASLAVSKCVRTREKGCGITYVRHMMINRPHNAVMVAVPRSDTKREQSSVGTVTRAVAGHSVVGARYRVLLCTPWKNETAVGVFSLGCPTAAGKTACSAASTFYRWVSMRRSSWSSSSRRRSRSTACVFHLWGGSAPFNALE